MMGSGLTIALALHSLDGYLSRWDLNQDLLSRSFDPTLQIYHCRGRLLPTIGSRDQEIVPTVC